MTENVSHWRLRGPEAVRSTAADILLIRSDVLAVHEGEDFTDVALRGDPPPLDEIDGLRVEALQPGAALTGLEEDAPIQVASDLLVRPPWVARPVDFRGIELIVPRGGAFGSGEHGSTQAALLALHRSWPAAPRRPAVAADVGTGSGILALYCAQRDAERVLACDVDPAAVRTARELLDASHAPAATEVFLGGAETLPVEGCDVVVANLDANELREHLDGVVACWSRRDVLVVSGTRPDEVDEVRTRVSDRLGGVAPVASVARGGYVAQVWLPPGGRGA